MYIGGKMLKKVFISIALFAFVFTLAGCGGSGGGSSSTPTGVNSGVPSVIKLLDVQNIAQTNSHVQFKARILDGNGVPVKNEPVTFTKLSSIGTIQALSNVTVAMTDNLGYATADVFSAEQGFVTVQAEVNSGIAMVRDRRTVFFTSGSLTLLPFMRLDVDDGDGSFNESDDFVLLEDENDIEVIVRATVFDQFGFPEAFSTVLFGADVPYRIGDNPTCTDGTDTCEVVFPDGVQKVTNSFGQAFVRVRFEANKLRSIQTLFNVLAQADNGAFNIVTLFVEPVFISSLNLSANPAIVDAGGTSDISASVVTNLNSPAPDGTVVSFTASCGAVEPFGQTTDGVATVQFTAPESEGTCTVTGTVSGLSGSVNVIVTVDLVALPASQTVNSSTGGTATYTITGGVPPYSIFSDNPALLPNPATVTISGGSFSVSVPAGAPAGTTTFTISDSAGSTVSVSLTVVAANAIAINPTTVSVTSGASPQSLIFQVSGGVPAYTATSSNSLIVCNDTVVDGVCDAGDSSTWTINNDGDSFTATVEANILGAGDSPIQVIITVQDSGSSPNVAATITINPPTP